MFRGVHTAIVTPFVESSSLQPKVDLDAFASLVQWQIDEGADGLVVFGTTGESATLSKEEKLSLAKKAVELANGKIPITAGSGSNNTYETIEFTKALQDTGVDACLAVAPYYNKPTQGGLLKHFTSLADEGGLPVVLYNVPSRTVTKIEVSTFRDLVQHENIVAVKQAVDSSAELLELSSCAKGSAAILAGDDPLLYTVLSMGGTGVISASSNVILKELLSVVEAWEKGDIESALVAQQGALPKINALFSETNPAPAKAALKMMGLIPSEQLRLPLVPVSERTRELLRNVLEL
jgi:4-hydroxy-tetrahydrodipicolinate synthase